ncbi:MAG: hypothetical protein ACMXYF_02620 [Candidatus Woesearchaeota archaeon]
MKLPIWSALFILLVSMPLLFATFQPVHTTTFDNGSAQFAQTAITRISAPISDRYTIDYHALVNEPISRFALATRAYQYIAVEPRETMPQAPYTIYFEVSQNWSSSDSIRLFYYDSRWQEIVPTLSSTTATHYQFRAQAPQLGYFAIAQKIEQRTLDLPDTEQNQSSSQNQTNQTPMPPTDAGAQAYDSEFEQQMEGLDPVLIGNIVIIASATLLILLISSYILVKTRKNDDNSMEKKILNSTRRTQDALSKFQSKYTTDEHKVKDLEKKIQQLEPKIVHKYVVWAKKQGFSKDEVEKNLLEYQIDKKLILKELKSF